MFGQLMRWFGAGKAEPVIDEAQWQRVEAGLPFLAYLPADARTRLREMALALLDTKTFHGAHGLMLTNDMLLAIALQACLPVYRIGIEAYSDWVGVVVYQGDFVIAREEVDEDGVVHEYDDPVLGEAWPGGPVIVSWPEGGKRADGLNVVIHEFTHKLDMFTGEADGCPPLPEDMDPDAWARILGAAYDDLCARIDHGRPTPFDPYAGESPAEFFAVMSEVFFETPRRLRDHYPAVYAQFRRLFGLDPAAGANP